MDKHELMQLLLALPSHVTHVLMPSGTSGYTPVTGVSVVQTALTNPGRAEHWRGEYEAQEGGAACAVLR